MGPYWLVGGCCLGGQRQPINAPPQHFTCYSPRPPNSQHNALAHPPRPAQRPQPSTRPTAIDPPTPSSPAVRQGPPPAAPRDPPRLGSGRIFTAPPPAHPPAPAPAPGGGGSLARAAGPPGRWEPAMSPEAALWRRPPAESEAPAGDEPGYPADAARPARPQPPQPPGGGAGRPYPRNDIVLAAAAAEAAAGDSHSAWGGVSGCGAADWVVWGGGAEVELVGPAQPGTAWHAHRSAAFAASLSHSSLDVRGAYPMYNMFQMSGMCYMIYMYAICTPGLHICFILLRISHFIYKNQRDPQRTDPSRPLPFLPSYLPFLLTRRSPPVLPPSLPPPPGRRPARPALDPRPPPAFGRRLLRPGLRPPLPLSRARPALDARRAADADAGELWAEPRGAGCGRGLRRRQPLRLHLRRL